MFVLKNNRGSAFPLTISVVLALLIIFTGICEYFRLVIIADGVKEALQDAVVSAVTENYANVYHGTREGYSGGYQPVADEFEQALDYGDIYSQLASVLDLEYTGIYEKTTDSGDLEFAVYNLYIDIRNAPLATSDDDEQRFEIDSYITLEVPVSFGGKLLPNLQIRLKTTAGYIPKF